MHEQDPLKKNRLGLRGMLLASGAVLAASSVFFLPEVGLLQGSAPTTTLPVPLPTAVPDGESGEPEARIQTEGAAAGPADAVRPLLPVYWLGEVEGTDRLFREFLVAPESTGDPISDAVRLMTSGQPLDSDYHSPWHTASSVSSSISTKNVITLDISSDAFSESLGESDARLALQQLVYTATAAASNAGLITGGESSSVVVLVDGAAGYRAFNSVDVGGEWTRDTSTLAPVWIIDPQEGVEADRSGLTIHGVGPTSEQTLAWRIDRSEGGPADGGTGDTSLFRDGSVRISPEDGAPGAYSFSVTLPPGSYEITVAVPSGDGQAQDSKSVVVR
jgi:hypothetical protein